MANPTRKKRILELRAKGFTLKAIAKKVKCSTTTVQYYITAAKKDATVAAERSTTMENTVQTSMERALDQLNEARMMAEEAANLEAEAFRTIGMLTYTKSLSQDTHTQ